MKLSSCRGQCRASILWFCTGQTIPHFSNKYQNVMNYLGVSNSDSEILNWIESWCSWQYSSQPITMFESILKIKPCFRKTPQIIYINLHHPFSSQDPLLYSVCSADLLPDVVRASVWGGEGLLVPVVLLPLPVNADGEYVATHCLADASSVHWWSWQCIVFAVLSRAILGSHHVHQRGPERERLCHCLSYVSTPVWSESIFSQVLLLLLLSSLSVHLSGMTVEVLGTVLGTAIQGQIVGGAPDCPTELDVFDSENATKNMTTIPLEETVSVLLFACQRVSTVLS